MKLICIYVLATILAITSAFFYFEGGVRDKFRDFMLFANRRWLYVVITEICYSFCNTCLLVFLIHINCIFYCIFQCVSLGFVFPWEITDILWFVQTSFLYLVAYTISNKYTTENVNTYLSIHQCIRSTPSTWRHVWGCNQLSFCKYLTL